MKKIGKKVIPLVIFFVLGFMSMGTAVPSEGLINMHAEVDATTIGLLDTINVKVTVNTENTARVPNPQLPDLLFFNILNESTKSQTSISIINGKTTRTKTITHIYTLEPKSKGTHTIDPISIEYKGQVYKTDPITITVVEGRVKSEKSVLSQEEDIKIDLDKLKEDIFILVTPEQSTIFEGQQLMLTYTLYSRLDIDSISMKESPEFPGFYKEEIFNATRLEYRKEIYEDKTYNATLLKKVALFPINLGTFTPQPLVLEMTVFLKGEALFDFFARPYTFLIKSNDLLINVEPLPQNSTGIPFSHIVGDLEINISKRENTANTGESTTCYLTLKSTGNLNLISDPGIGLSKRGRVYLSETSMDTVEEEDKVYFVKKFEYTIIPEESGQLIVSAGDLLFYDIGQGAYMSISPEPVEIKITGKDIYQEKPIIGQKRSYSEGGFHFIKGNVKELKSVSPSIFSSSYYYFYHIILVAATGILFFIKMKREKLEKNQNLFKMKKARGLALEILKEADLAISTEHYSLSIDHIYSALATYIAYKCGKKPQEVTIKNIHALLDTCFPISRSTKSAIEDVLKQCTMLKFSKENSNDGNMIHDLYEKTVAAIEEVESQRPAQSVRENEKNIKR
jgi:hypothetical protein